MYNVFTDFHHAGLLQSLILLFEKRWGGNVYRPIGMEWFERGYWKVYDHPATVQQYLGIGGATPDGTPPLNEIVTVTKQPDPVYFCHDIDSDMTNKAISYNHFMNTRIDIVIASLPYHIEPFKRLCVEHPNKPKLIYQIGNSWTSGAGLAPNVMASAIINDIPSDVHFISYLQEFDTSIFKVGLVNDNKKITSLVNCFGSDGLFADDFTLFKKVERLMPEYDFKAYGAQGRDGCMHGAKQVARAIDESMFVWHTKRGGDGYGHVVHNTAYMGKPMIVKKQYYAGKLAERFMIDGDTCVVIDGLNPEQIRQKIITYSDPEKYQTLCENMRKLGAQYINFDEQAKQLNDYMAKLR